MISSFNGSEKKLNVQINNRTDEYFLLAFYFSLHVDSQELGVDRRIEKLDTETDCLGR